MLGFMFKARKQLGKRLLCGVALAWRHLLGHVLLWARVLLWGQENRGPRNVFGLWEWGPCPSRVWTGSDCPWPPQLWECTCATCLLGGARVRAWWARASLLRLGGMGGGVPALSAGRRAAAW